MSVILAGKKGAAPLELRASMAPQYHQILKSEMEEIPPRFFRSFIRFFIDDIAHSNRYLGD